MTLHSPLSQPSRIIFFDGVCGLCNASVDFILKHDSKHYFRYAPLQGKTAQNTLEPSYRDDLSTLVLFENQKTHTQSGAALKILMTLGFPWNLSLIFWIIPKPIRDFFYRLVAKNRYAWFGKRDQCRLPNPEERNWFLD